MIRGVIPPTTDIGVKQRLESLTKAAQDPTATAYSITLPAPGPDQRGRFVICRGSDNLDTLYVCLLASTGVYTWHPVVQSS